MIKNFLFGKKKYFKTSGLGIFETRVKSNSVENKIWQSSIQIDNNSIVTSVILDGDSNTPYSNQIDSVSNLVKQFDQVKQNIIHQIKSNTELSRKLGKYNLQEMNLCSINPWDKSQNLYELTYEIESNEICEITVIWGNGIIDISC